MRQAVRLTWPWMAGKPTGGACHICTIAFESPLGPPETTLPQGEFGVKFPFIFVKQISPGNEKVSVMRTLWNKVRMKLQVTHFQQRLFENRVIFTLQSRGGGWPGGGLEHLHFTLMLSETRYHLHCPHTSG